MQNQQYKFGKSIDKEEAESLKFHQVWQTFRQNRDRNIKFCKSLSKQKVSMRKRLLIFTNTNLLNNIWKVKQIQECFTLLMVILKRRSLLEAKKRETYKNVSHFWQWFLCTEVNCSLEEGKFRSKFGNELFFCDIYWYYWRKTLMLFMNGKT